MGAPRTRHCLLCLVGNPALRVNSGGLPTRPGLGAPKARGPSKGPQGVSVGRSGSLEVTSAIGDSIPVG
jgi:hypothetical protein